MGQLLDERNFDSTPTFDTQTLGQLSLAKLRKIIRGLPVKAAIVLRMLGGLERGSLALTLPDGKTIRIIAKQSGPAGQLTLNNWRLPVKLMRDALIGIGESYVDGDWDSTDVTKLLTLFSVNLKLANRMSTPAKISGLIARARHWLNANSKKGSKRNISAHYDLGNAFYAKWLDPSMTYSSALFSGKNLTLEQAQRAKYANLAKLAGIKPGDHVLEIGCGWGGFAHYAASEIGCRVTGLTISREQLDYAQQRITNAGLDHLVELKFQDYRDETRKYDKIISIEMFEAVGEAWWETYYSQLNNCLKPGGSAGLQIITIAEESYEDYRKRPDFIQRHVFPGGMLPPALKLTQLANSVGLRETKIDRFGHDYAKTLALWRDRFGDQWESLKPLGFDNRFKRLWDFYLHYCEAGFATDNVDVCQIALKKPG